MARAFRIAVPGFAEERQKTSFKSSTSFCEPNLLTKVLVKQFFLKLILEGKVPGTFSRKIYQTSPTAIHPQSHHPYPPLEAHTSSGDFFIPMRLTGSFCRFIFCDRITAGMPFKSFSEPRLSLRSPILFFFARGRAEILEESGGDLGLHTKGGKTICSRDLLFRRTRAPGAIRRLGPLFLNYFFTACVFIGR